MASNTASCSLMRASADGGGSPTTWIRAQAARARPPLLAAFVARCAAEPGPAARGARGPGRRPSAVGRTGGTGAWSPRPGDEEGREDGADGADGDSPRDPPVTPHPRDESHPHQEKKGLQWLCHCAALSYQAVGDHAPVSGRWKDLEIWVQLRCQHKSIEQYPTVAFLSVYSHLLGLSRVQTWQDGRLRQAVGGAQAA